MTMTLVSLGRPLRLLTFRSDSKNGKVLVLSLGNNERSCETDHSSQRKSSAAVTVAPPVPEMINTLPVPPRFGRKETVA